MIRTYTKLDGTVLDLSGISPEEEAYFDRCYRAYCDKADWMTVARLVTGSENPLLRPTGGVVTRTVWQKPLFRAVRDLENRAGIRSEDLDPSPGDAVDRDPLDDDWLPVPAAAEAKGVTVTGLHGAIRRGAVLAGPAKPGGAHLVVSRNSLAHWQPGRSRQPSRRRANVNAAR